MRFLLLFTICIQFLFSQELTRKIMVSSFNSQKDADYALTVFNEKRTQRFIELQNKLGFEVIARPSDHLYVIAIEAFKDYNEAKEILNEIYNEHPDAYINKYKGKQHFVKKDTKKDKIKEIFPKEIKEPKKKQEVKIVRNIPSFDEIETKEVKQEPLEVEKKQEVQEIKTEVKTNEKKEQQATVFNKYSILIHSKEDIQEQIKRNLSVFPLIKDSSIIKVEYKDLTAQRATNFVNELLNQYIKQNQEENSRQLKESLEFISIQLEKAKEDLAISERELESFRSENLLFNTNKKVEQINKQKNDLQKELLSVKRKNKIFNSIKDSLLKGELISSTTFEDKTLNDAIKELNEVRSNEQELSTKYTPSHKTMIALHEKIISLEDGIIKNVKNIEISLNESKRSLQSQIKELDEEILLIPRLAMELSKLERRFDLKESVYKDLLLKYNDTTSKYISSKRVNRVIDYAQEPEFPIKPSKKMILIIGFMLALLIAFIVVLIKEYFDVYLKRPSDLINLSKTSYYGYIPFVKSRNYNKLFIFDDLTSQASEALRTIRSGLDLTNKKDDARVILTTSRVSNEGKSTFITNLASMIALSGKKTILLGLDLRIPQLHMKFDIQNNKGMSDLLVNNVSIKEVTQTVKLKDGTNEHFLDVITSGTIPPNPSELIENGSIDEIIENLRKEYDYILIDSTPTALVPDTLSLLNKADTTLFVYKSEYSKKEFIKQNDQLINKYQLKSVGYVLTSVKKKYYEQIKYDKNYTLYPTKIKY